jgi:Fe-S-cluster-containing hydrogenase component 2
VLENTGIATEEMFRQTLPSAERRKRGPYAVLECYEHIPCNPCVTGCAVRAVAMDDINGLPRCDHDVCTGCTMCVGICPGLACFVIDETVGDEKIKITFPYELSRVPAKGDIVNALGRDGSVVGTAEVLRVIGGKKLDRTHLITVLVDDSLIYDVRGIAVR